MYSLMSLSLSCCENDPELRLDLIEQDLSKNELVCSIKSIYRDFRVRTAPPFGRKTIVDRKTYLRYFAIFFANSLNSYD